MSGSSASTGGMPSSERSDVEDHAQDRGEPDQQKHDCGNQGERNGIGAFSVNEARRFHGVSRMAKAEHKLHVVDDAADQHEDDERDAEVARGAGVRDRACFRNSWGIVKPKEISDSEVRIADISVRSALKRVRWKAMPVRRAACSTEIRWGSD